MNKTAGLLLLCCISVVQADSLYNEASFKALTADKRAGQPGDTVTILVMENAQAKSSAGTSIERDSAVQLQSRDNGGINQLGVGIGSSSDGDAAINRNGFVKAQITAVVQSKDQNGNLEVVGEQSITIDGEVQSISVTGWIRPTDISANNVVPSFRLFNARIRFSGEGQVSDGQKAGLLSRVMTWLGL
jgi:flagellar L-ring protein precursor FlgH